MPRGDFKAVTVRKESWEIARALRDDGVESSISKIYEKGLELYVRQRELLFGVGDSLQCYSCHEITPEGSVQRIVVKKDDEGKSIDYSCSIGLDECPVVTLYKLLSK